MSLYAGMESSMNETVPPGLLIYSLADHFLRIVKALSMFPPAPVSP